MLNNPNATPNRALALTHALTLTPDSNPNQVTMCYVDPSAPVGERQKVLQGHYRFTCRCKRCARELAECA